MKRVEVIRAEKPGAAKADKKCRVAAYCRVSTDSDEQEGSYEAQRTHYEKYILSNADWELAGIYADEGISGTQVRGRKEFERMIEDCKAGRIQLVITKSISRFARNTVDCIKYIRELKQMGIPIIFEKENINTMDAKGELLITIMASIAQEESQSISQNVRMGIQYRMQQGKGRLNTSIFLGLARGEDGRLTPIPGEAEIIQGIYRAFVDGDSPHVIARRLGEARVPTPAGGDHWHPSTVRRILMNEKYCGDLLLQKYYVTDFLTHRTVRNEGRFPMYFVANAHDPLVPRELFMEVQAELIRRSTLRWKPVKLRAGSPELLKGRLVCGICGRILHKCEMPDGRIQWRCSPRNFKMKVEMAWATLLCPLPPIAEEEMKDLILEAFDDLPRQVEAWVRPRREALERARERMDALVGKPEKSSEGGEEGVSVVELPKGEKDFGSILMEVSDNSRKLDRAYIRPGAEAAAFGAGEIWQGSNVMVLARAELTRRIWDLRFLEELAGEIREGGSEGRSFYEADTEAGGAPEKNAFCLEGTVQSETKGNEGNADPEGFEGSEARYFAARNGNTGREEKKSAGRERNAGMEKKEDAGHDLACREYGEFLERTRVHLPREDFGEDGSLKRLEDALAIRCLDRVIVGREDVLITFQAGLAIRLERRKK